MLDGKKVIVVMPAYNAEKTLENTLREVPRNVVDEIIVVDDASSDGTVEICKRLGLLCVRHTTNRGYGGNQKTCYTASLANGADIIIMLHPDYQYTPRLIGPMASMVASGLYDIVLGSRMLCGGALAGGMPLYKYVANKFLTFVENILLNSNLSEYHTGYRAFSRSVIEALPLLANSDDFVFDNQMLAQAIYKGFSVGEITCPTRYTPVSSSINFPRSVKYGLGVLITACQFRLAKWNLIHPRIFSSKLEYTLDANRN